MTKKGPEEIETTDSENVIIHIEEEILDAEKVAEMLNSSKKVVERELREGNLKGTKRLNKWFILKSDLIDYIKRGS